MGFEMYAVARDNKKRSLQNLFDQTTAQLGQEKQQIQQEQAQTLPTFNNQIAAENQRGWQETQNLAKLAARTGNLGSDQLTTNQAMINQNVWNRQGDINTQRNQYNQGVMNKLWANAQAQDQAKNQYNSGVASADQEYAAQLADAEAQLAQQQAAARASAARASAPKPLSRTAQNQNNTDQAMSEIKSLYDSRVSYDDALKQYQAVKAQMMQDGVNTSALEKYMQALWANANYTPTNTGNLRMYEQQLQ